MSLGDHLRELRNRVIIALVAIIAGAVVGWLHYDSIIERLIEPLKDVAAERGAQIARSTSPAMTDAFAIQLTVALFVGLILASPVWLLQIWGFIVPGLTKKEKRVAGCSSSPRCRSSSPGARGLPHGAQGRRRPARLHP